jgi:hypothetical protein
MNGTKKGDAMPGFKRPVCAKCEGTSFRFTVASFQEHKAEAIESLERELVSKVEHQQAAIGSALAEAEHDVERLGQAFKAKRDRFALERERKQELWREEVAHVRQAIKKEMQGDDDLALLMDENELERIAQGRVGNVDEELTKLDTEVKSLALRYETRVAEVRKAVENKATDLCNRQLAQVKRFGRQTENETVSVVFCTQCGHIAGVCPNPTATRFNETCDLLKILATTIGNGNAEILATNRQLV